MEDVFEPVPLGTGFLLRGIERVVIFRELRGESLEDSISRKSLAGSGDGRATSQNARSGAPMPPREKSRTRGCYNRNPRLDGRGARSSSG